MRGFALLAVGYVIGYAHAASRDEDIMKRVEKVKQAWNEPLGEDHISYQGMSAQDTPEGESQS